MAILVPDRGDGSRRLKRIFLSGARPQALCADGAQERVRAHTRRHRRLDLCALARGVLSQGLEAGRGACLRRVASHLDRDQRHPLPAAKSQRASANGPRPRRTASSSPSRARASSRSRRFSPRRATSSAASSTSGWPSLATSSGPCSGNSRPSRDSIEPDFAKFLEHLPRELDGLKLNHVVEARHASFRTPRVHQAPARRRRDRGLRRGRGLSFHRRPHRRVVYARLQKGSDALPDGLSASRAGRLGRARQGLGEGRRRRRTFRLSMPRTSTTPSRATCSSTSSMKASCALLPQPWRSSSGLD